MKVVHFAVKDHRAAQRGIKRDLIAAWEAARGKKKFPGPKESIIFSPEIARQILTPKRLALIRLIKAKKPKSLYELAKLAKRSFPGVLKDAELLRRNGVITLTRQETSPRRAVRPSAPYDAIRLHITV